MTDDDTLTQAARFPAVDPAAETEAIPRSRSTLVEQYAADPGDLVAIYDPSQDDLIAFQKASGKRFGVVVPDGDPRLLYVATNLVERIGWILVAVLVMVATAVIAYRYGVLDTQRTAQAKEHAALPSIYIPLHEITDPT